MVAASTMCTALGSDALPTMDMVVAVVAGCGGDGPDVARFVTAWRQIRLGQEDTGSALAAPARRVVPAAEAR